MEAVALTLLLIVITLGIGFVGWSVAEWRHGRTPSYRLLGLRVVRRFDARPIGLGRSFLRSGVCCPLMIIPTIVACVVVGICFVLGASPPDGLLRQPRAAPWDRVTATKVLDERVEPSVEPTADRETDHPVARAAPVSGPGQNGHDPG